jgi:hypothetical protein
MATLKQGWGYWNLAGYPYRGSFRRAIADTPITVTGPGVKPHEVSFRFSDGKPGIADKRAIEEVEVRNADIN